MTNTKEPADSLTASEVEDYLKQYPNFFRSRDTLLEALSLTGDSGNTVSLVERQVDGLREQNAAITERLDELISVAERNNEVFNKCRSLVLSLISSSDSDSFFSALEQSFKREFNSTTYSLIIFGKEPRHINHFASIVSEASAADYVGTLMRAKEPVLGVLRPPEQDFLFRHASDKIESAAVLAVRAKNLNALLAIGSESPTYFESGLGTLFIGFVADALALLLPKHLDN